MVECKLAEEKKSGPRTRSHNPKGSECPRAENLFLSLSEGKNPAIWEKMRTPVGVVREFFQRDLGEHLKGRLLVDFLTYGTKERNRSCWGWEYTERKGDRAEGEDHQQQEEKQHRENGCYQ